MRAVALLDSYVVMREIPVDLGRRQSEAPVAWPAHANLALTYHPGSDIV